MPPFSMVHSIRSNMYEFSNLCAQLDIWRCRKLRRWFSHGLKWRHINLSNQYACGIAADTSVWWIFDFLSRLNKTNSPDICLFLPLASRPGLVRSDNTEGFCPTRMIKTSVLALSATPLWTGSSTELDLIKWGACFVRRSLGGRSAISSRIIHGERIQVTLGSCFRKEGK